MSSGREISILIHDGSMAYRSAEYLWLIGAKYWNYGFNRFFQPCW
jgi:hypothetical protein